MRLENFDLDRPYGSITLVGLGHEWDLHSWATFIGIRFAPERDELILEWQVPLAESNPWSSPGNKAVGCRLVFRKVRLFSMSSRDNAYPQDSSSLRGVSKASPEVSEFRFQDKWAIDEPFHLLFDFEDERRVEVDAESAVLEALL